jgi:hypothetical protein
MRLALAAAAAATLLATRPARADTEQSIELSAAAGTDSGAAGTGFGVLGASARAELYRVSPPVLERGMSLPVPDDDGGGDDGGDDDSDPGPGKGMWIFVGLEPGDRDSIGLAGDVSLRSAGGSETLLQLASRAWARGFGWQLEGRLAVDPPGTLRDPYWRSNRNTVQTNIAFETPPMWAIGSERMRFETITSRVDLGWRRTRDGADQRWVGGDFDRSISIEAAKLRTRFVDVNIFDASLVEYGVAERSDATMTYGKSVLTFDLGVSALARLYAGVELFGRVGFASRMPLAPFSATSNSSHSYGASADTVDYWLELRRGAPEGSPGPRFTLGAGTWARLDPTGHAADVGKLATATLAWRRGVLDTRVDVQLGRLERDTIGMYAPADLAPVGTRFVMGRGALSIGAHLGHDLTLTAGVWLERSDRDDPRWATPSTGAVTTHAGAEVAAAWRFSR